MTALGIIGFTVINVAIIDFLARLLLRHTRETSFYKAAGLWALFLLALTRNGAVLPDQKAAMSRFLLSVTFFIFLLTIILVVFGASANPSSPVLFLSVMPLLVMPFYHLIFGIFGQRPLLVLSSIKHFRLRGVVAVVIGANVVLSLIGTKASSLLLATHTAIALLAMVNVFYFVALSRAKMSFYSIDREDSDRSPMAFFYYLSALLEFFLYCALLHHYVLIKLWALFGQETMSITLVFVSFIILYFCCFIFAKLFMIQRRAIGLDFFERGLLPISFMLFVVALLFEHY